MDAPSMADLTSDGDDDAVVVRVEASPPKLSDATGEADDGSDSSEEEELPGVFDRFKP
jgi:hypothetical protein